TDPMSDLMDFSGMRATPGMTMRPEDAATRSMVSWFTRIARQHAGGPAVLDDHGSLTYEELRARASAIASWLTAEIPGSDVGVALAHGRELITVLLGVIMAGKAYV